MKMMTTTELAAEFGTDSRTLRKFLRSDASGIESVGKGARYSLPSSKREIASLAKRYAKWDEARTAAKSDNTPEVTEAPTEVEAPELPESDLTPEGFIDPTMLNSDDLLEGLESPLD